MPPAVPVEAHETITNEDGKILERSQEDGELYSKPTIGIIYPPPEVRNIVDRTANFVARNGPEFEDRIRGNEAENPKFNFLNPNDPYNAYYENKLKEFREGDLSEPVGLATQMKDIIKPAAQPKQNLEIIETIVPKDPPTPYEYVCDPPTISAIDLDLVKLTAQFVAKNGKGFLTNLMNREQRNYQFDFLRPQHSLFQYFTKLVEQYTKILLPSNDIVETLSKDTKNPWKVLDRVKYRVEWQRYQDREKQKIEDEKERERVAYAQIDWHDFVVVETVNFRETETANLPPPVSKDQLGSRILQQERIDKLKDGEGGEATSNMAAGDQVEMDVENEEEEQLYEPSSRDNDDDQTKQDSDMDEASDEEDNTPNQPPLPPPVAPPGAGANVTIRKNYDPKSKPSAPSTSVQDGFMISPLTGEKVPIESMAAHMKISLLDPRWKEQKERALEEKKQQEQVFAEGVHIGDTLKQLAERRSDIFGVGAEETLIGRKLGEEEEQMKVTKEIWDGHTASMERATKLAHSNITFEDQIKAIHRAKGLLPSEGAEKIGPSVPEKSYGHAVSQQPPIVIPPPLPKMTQPPAPKPLPKESDIVSSSQPPPHSTSSVTATPMPPPAAPPTAPPRPPNMPQAPLLGQPPIRPPPLLPPPGLLLPPQQGPPQHGQFLPMPMSDGSQGLILPPPSSADDDGPLMKKQKLDTEADLMSEQEYLQKNTSPVTFRVQVPEIPEKSDWQCQGQVLQITLPLTDQCSVVKAKIFEMIDMPAGKQKLQLGTFFIKDSNSLAYYNFSSTTLLHLQLKERGGRKK